MRRVYMRWCVGIAVSLLMLFWVFRDVDVPVVLGVIEKMHPWGPWVYVLMTVLSQNIRTWRFAYMVRMLNPTPWRLLFHIGNTGHLAVFALPFRLGEFTRPYLMRKHGVALAKGLAVVAIERILDGLFMVGCFFACVTVLPLSEDMLFLKTSAYAALALFVFCGVVCVWCVKHPKVLIAVCEAVNRRTGWPVHHHAKLFLEGLSVIPDMYTLCVLTVFSVVGWTCAALATYGLMRAFHFEASLSCGFFVNAVLALGVLVPAGPGFVGVYQAALLVAFNVYGYRVHDAVAFGLLAYPLGVVVLLLSLLPTAHLWFKNHRGTLSVV